ncbi:MAG: Hsp20/alpha crystallin family protein [Cyanobacteria bacterium]|nr:Hsp20/alpha crystallin family protein [Cyanobacteriota bacterium]
MFYNRFPRQMSVEQQRRTYVRPSLSHTNMMSYGPMNYGYRHELNREIRDFNRDSMWNWNHNVHTVTAPADILELDEQFIIEVALPGVVLDDVQLKIEDNVLSITAKRTPTLFEERATILQKELPAVYLLRQFEFDCDTIIPEQIDARLDRGILYISIPKVEVALRVPVSSGIIESHLPNSPKTRVSSKHEVNVK